MSACSHLRICQLLSVVSLVHVVRDDQMVLAVDRRLHVVIDGAGTAAANCHERASGSVSDFIVGRRDPLFYSIRRSRGSSIF